MKKKVWLITLVSILGFSFSAFGEHNSVLLPIATCSAEIDKIPTSLDLFEEMDFKTGKRTGKGFALQTSGWGEEVMKLVLPLDIEFLGEGRGRSVIVYSALNPTVMFSRFNLTPENKDALSIYATQFKAVWGVFKCNFGP